MPEQAGMSSGENLAKGRLLNSMAMFLLAGGCLFAGVTLVFWQQGQGSPLDVLGGLGIALIGLVIYVLNRRRAQRAAGLVLCVVLALVPTYYVLLEGPKSTSILLMVGGVVLADFLLGGRSGIYTALIECLLYLAAGIAYGQGWLGEASYTSPFIGDAVTMVAVCLALALTAGHFAREMKSALHSAQEKEQALRRADAEKDRLLAELVARREGQRLLLERVHELGSPIIPLSEGVIAMPIIGAMDEQRSTDVTRALLSGVETQHVRVALVDVTGIPAMDAQLGRTLLRMAQGVRLLGAEPVLTGLSPAAARNLVDLDLDLSLVTTRATLQEGLDYALGQLG